MKLLPESFFGWIFIFIFLFTQVATNPGELLERLELGENFLVLSLDYLVFPIATGYLIFFKTQTTSSIYFSRLSTSSLSIFSNKSE